jgi:hypothetical protein
MFFHGTSGLMHHPIYLSVDIVLLNRLRTSCQFIDVALTEGESSRRYNWATLFLGDLKGGGSREKGKYGREFCGTWT